MKITRATTGLQIEVPLDVADAIGLKEGDDVTVRATPDGNMELVRLDDWETTLAVIERLSRPLPPDYRFDREEANTR